ncbi:MAG: response regulator [Bacteroidota bacterium]
MEIKNILLVDDSDIDNMVNKRVIMKAGYTEQVTVKISAQAALDYLSECSNDQSSMIPDLILLDIRMPEIDGFGFLERFEKLPVQIHQKTNIVMLSSSIDAEDIRRAEENRFVKKFVNKPLKKETIDILRQI